MLVIFDVDGTLIDSWNWMAGELAKSAERFGYRSLDRPDIESLRGQGTAEVLKALEVKPEQLMPLVEHLRRRAETVADGLKPFPGMPELLTNLNQAGDELALVSSNSHAAVERALGGKLHELFVHRSCGIGIFDKADTFRAIVTTSGYEAGATLCVGDETRDLDAAAEAGLAAFAVEWGYAKPSVLRRKAPGRTAATPNRLAEMITARRGEAIRPT